MVVNTGAVDRERDRVLPSGAELDNYRANPVIMYGHNYRDPWALIGRAAEIQTGPESIRIRPELREPASESDPMHIIRALWDSGLLKAASIGFNPLEWEQNDVGGYDYTRWELLENSLVPIPANQEALRLAVKAIEGDAIIDRQAAREEIGEWLDNTAQESNADAIMTIDATYTGANDTLTITWPDGTEQTITATQMDVTPGDTGYVNTSEPDERQGDPPMGDDIDAQAATIDDTPESQGDPADDEPTQAQMDALVDMLEGWIDELAQQLEVQT